MSETTALATTSQQQSAGALAFLTDGAAFEHLWRVAKAFSLSKMVPPHFQGKPEDCMIALMMAQQLELNPLTALQNINVIQGRAGFSASFAISLANTRGPFAGPISWSSEGQGDTLQVTAHAIIKATGEQVSSIPVTMKMAAAEGWTKNPKYRSMPEQMLRYRSAVWLIRTVCPEVLLGLQSVDDDDVAPVRVRDVQPTGSTGDVVTDLNRQIAASVAVTESDSDKNRTVLNEETHHESETVEVVDADDPF